MIQFKIKPIAIPMRVSFKHASFDRKVSESLWVEAERSGKRGLGEGCPRKYVTGETLDRSLEWAHTLTQKWTQHISQSTLSEIDNVKDLQDWVNQNRKEIDQFPSAWCAIELALLDLFAKESNQSVEDLLGLKPKRNQIQYSAVLSDDSLGSFKRKIAKYKLFGFWDYKIKVGSDGAAEEDHKKLEYIAQEFFHDFKPRELGSLVRFGSYLMGRTRKPFRVRLDANNAWKNLDEAKNFVSKIKFPIFGLEEPLAARSFESFSKFTQETGIPIILDESLCNLKDLEDLAPYGGNFIVNIRISKMGGVLRSLEILRAAEKLGWKVIVGAQVGETSVLSRAAWTVSREAGESLVACEGAFGTKLLSDDAVRPVVQFGWGGVCGGMRVWKERLGWGLESKLESAL